MKNKKARKLEPIKIPTVECIKVACEKYDEKEPRAYIYKEARELIAVGSISYRIKGVLLLLSSWNMAAYKNDFPKKEQIKNAIIKLDEFLKSEKNKFFEDIIKSEKGQEFFEKAFNLFIEATSSEKLESPVGTAKALHVLYPAMFPIWDEKIAKNHKISGFRHESAKKYRNYCIVIGALIENIRTRYPNEHGEDLDKKTLLKNLDTFNYGYYVKKYIEIRKERKEMNSTKNKFYLNRDKYGEIELQFYWVEHTN